MEVLSPLTGLLTKNYEIVLLLNFSEPLSSLLVRYPGHRFFSNHTASQELHVKRPGDGNFTLELLAVDLAGNVQKDGTRFNWAVDSG